MRDNFPRAVLFDLDGLLVDSEPLYQRAWSAAAADVGYELSSEYYFRQLSGRHLDDYSDELLDHYGAKFPVSTFKRRCAVLVSQIAQTEGILVKDGAENTLQWLRGASILCAVATESGKVNALRFLRLSRLESYFEETIVREDVENGKPSPELFLVAAERLDVHPNDCVVLEDSNTGVLAARRAGMRSIMIPDRQTPNPESLKIACSIVKNLSEARSEIEVMSHVGLSA